MDNYKNREFIDPSRGYLYIALAEHEVKENMLGHEKWIEIPEGADCLMQWPTGHKVFYRNNFAESWNSAYREWHFVSGDDGVDQSITLWKRQPQDPALISGAEAELVAQAKKFITSDHLNRFEAAEAHLEGHPVQFMLANGDFIDITSDTTLGIFEKDGGYSFRLKPQTIKLELELPKPFEPKEGETYWHIYPSAEKGYHFVRSFEDDDVWCQFGAWRTEEEIKQVVEQLRKIRGTNS
ncbi:hypothetical protein OHW97_01970 [Acinetobacter baumannii]|nr:hypothetical protein [Acinetobacter baumannii]